MFFSININVGPIWPSFESWPPGCPSLTPQLHLLLLCEWANSEPPPGQQTHLVVVGRPHTLRNLVLQTDVGSDGSGVNKALKTGGRNSPESRASRRSPSDRSGCWWPRTDTPCSGSPADGRQPPSGAHLLTHRCGFVWHPDQVVYLVEPEVVRLQKLLKFGEKPVVVEVIDGLHVACAVVQITCDLRDGQSES